MLYEDDHCLADDPERNLRGWFGWLADPDPDVRQFAARQATLNIERFGLTWDQAATIMARAVAERRRSRAA